MAKLMEVLSKALPAATAALVAMAALAATSAANSKTERAAAKHKAWIEKSTNAIQ